jgi:cysteine desulfurase
MTAPPSIYLDNAASTPPLPAVVDAMAEAQRQLFGNPSSAHSFGPPARNALEDAREFLRGTLGAARLVFTSGGSEADYLGIVGSAAPRPSGRVLMAASDHPALLQCAELLARYRHRVTVLPVTAHGDVAPETLFEALGQDVRTVALMFGHNELGTLCQLRELVDLVRRTAPGAHVHVDLVQTYGKLPFDLDELHVDSVAVSGHKFHGPRGAGFLALSSTAEVAPLQLAGGQEHGLRGGTENVAGAIGLRVAAEHALSHQAAHEAHMRELAALTFATVRDTIPDAERLGHPERALPHILSMRLPGVVAPTLLVRCDARGVAFSSGSACHTGTSDKVNPVLAAIGLDKKQAREVVRVSFSAMTPRADAQVAARIIADEARLLRDAAPRDSAHGNRASGAGR